MDLSRFRALIPGVKEHDESFNKMRMVQNALQGEGDLSLSVPYGEGTAIGGVRESYKRLRVNQQLEPKEKAIRQRHIGAAAGLVGSMGANLYNMYKHPSGAKSTSDYYKMVKDNPLPLAGAVASSYGAYKATQLDPVSIPLLAAGSAAVIHGTQGLPTSYRVAATIGATAPGFLAGMAKAHQEGNDLELVKEIIADHDTPALDRLKELAVVHNAKGLERTFPILSYAKGKEQLRGHVEGQQATDPATYHLESHVKAKYVQQMHNDLLGRLAAEFEQKNGRSPSPKEFNKLELEVERKLFP